MDKHSILMEIIGSTPDVVVWPDAKAKIAEHLIKNGVMLSAEAEELKADNQRLREMWAKAVSETSKANASQWHWIPASTPPEKDGEYLVCGPTLKPCVKDFCVKPRFTAQENVWYEYNSLVMCCCSINNSVTHWTHIPEGLSRDEFVEFWHQNETGKSLRNFLGMTPTQYEEWLKRGEVSEQ